jgi:hypothetical protein
VVVKLVQIQQPAQARDAFMAFAFDALDPGKFFLPSGGAPLGDRAGKDRRTGGIEVVLQAPVLAHSDAHQVALLEPRSVLGELTEVADGTGQAAVDSRVRMRHQQHRSPAAHQLGDDRADRLRLARAGRTPDEDVALQRLSQRMLLLGQQPVPRVNKLA